MRPIGPAGKEELLGEVYIDPTGDLSTWGKWGATFASDDLLEPDANREFERTGSEVPRAIAESGRNSLRERGRQPDANERLALVRFFFIRVASVILLPLRSGPNADHAAL